MKQDITLQQKMNGWLYKRPWGGWSLISLYISILSGILVGLQYDYSAPFYSASSIDLLVPFGRFFRSLHFFSSQTCFLFATIHFFICYGKSEKLPLSEWSKLLVSLLALLLLLFTGYVLRGDNTGASAGIIAENLIKSIPVLGSYINELFYAITASGLRKVYVYHVIGLDVLLLVVLWNHLRIYRVQLTSHSPLIAMTILFSIFVAAPLEPEQLGRQYISGPWFFLGLQELLRYFPPLVAGVIAPSILAAMLYGIFPGNRFFQKELKLMILGWLSVYAILSVIAWNR
jgi:ubiquinol-cytochrome c reductase cytochrome b subunit